MSKIENFLQNKKINYTFYEHPAVYTCQQAEKYCQKVPGLNSKNLLLQNQKRNRYFLLVLPSFKQADLKGLARIVQEKKLSFIKAEVLKEKFNIEPGAVSPFVLLNDEKKEIETYIDQNVYEAEVVNFHPNRNTASLVLSKEMFHKFLKIVENSVRIV